MKLVPFKSLGMVSNSNWESILYHFRDKARYWLKNRDFFIPRCIWRPSEYCNTI